MHGNLLLGLAGIIVLGIAAQLLAWRLHVPSILVLLLAGFLAGPVAGLLRPDALFGELLLPLVSLSVAIILFEGGLSLRVAGLRGAGAVVRNLITVGVLVTWFVGAAAAHFLLHLDLALALLLGAILVVTGPTVIGPLLRHVRPSGRVGSILMWEGIVIDPVGAVLALLVFEGIGRGRLQEATALAVVSLVKTILAGGAVGALGALLLILVLKRYWIPDFLQNPVALMAVLSGFVASNLLQAESGLLAVTVMGVILANQTAVAVKHIVEFKQSLRVVLISSLFVLLAARLQLGDLRGISLNSVAFLVILIVLARPVAVAVSTAGSGLTLAERLFLAWMAPRGIVAAAVASVFALRLAEAGYPQVDVLVPITFLVIIATVAIYGLTASPLARRLGLARLNPQGVLIVGAHSWARALAAALKAEGFPVLLVDTNWASVSAARMAGLPAYHGNILAEYVADELDLGGIGRLLALTSNDEANSLAALRFAEVFGRRGVYQLPTSSRADRAAESASVRHLRGRSLFRRDVAHGYLTSRFIRGAVVKTTKLTEAFDYDAFQRLYADTAVPLFVVDEDGNLAVCTAGDPPTPAPGQRLIALVDPVQEPPVEQPSPPEGPQKM